MITGQSECQMDDIVPALITLLGVQDPESRRKARQLKRKGAESDDGNNLVDLEDFHDDDSDLESLSKRQRRSRCTDW